MKKKYEKPEVYEEDVRIKFVGTCCNTTPEGNNPSFVGTPGELRFCGPACHWGNYAQAG